MRLSASRSLMLAAIGGSALLSLRPDARVERLLDVALGGDRVDLRFRRIDGRVAMFIDGKGDRVPPVRLDDLADVDPRDLQRHQ